LELGICADLIRDKNNYELCIYHNDNSRNIKFKSVKKKGGCESCKEKATKLKQEQQNMAKNKHFLSEQQPANNISNEDILFAHMVLKASGATQEYKDKANSIYKSIFNEDVVYSCCKNKAYIKLDYYVRNTLKLL
jgi:hypothetical protein